LKSGRTARLLLLAVATLFALAVAEVALRIVWHNPYRNEVPDNLLKLRMHHPGTDHIYSREHIDANAPTVRFRTDERGYTLPSVHFEDARATVVFFGGSTTECAAVQEELRFPVLVSALLVKEGLKVNTLNIARSGSNVHDEINVLFNHVVADRPDFAVLMEASNDIGMLREPGGYAHSMGLPVSFKLTAKWLLQMMSSRSALAGLLRQSSLPEGLRPKDPTADWRQTEAPADSGRVDMYRSRLKTFVHMCRDFHIEPVLMTQPYSHQRTSLTPVWLDETAQDQFNEVIREVGRSENVLVIDLMTHLRRDVPGWNTPNDIFYDAIHVTDRGSHVYADYIAAQLRPLIAAHNPVSR
jgi:hypothetical protein